MSLDFNFISKCIIKLLNALPLTLLITVMPFALGGFLGLIFALILQKKVFVLSGVVRVFNSFFRSVPLILLLFLGYYGTPRFINYFSGTKIISSADINNNVTAIIILTLYSTAFLCEIIRGAMKSVDVKQLEAGYVLGMSKSQILFGIYIPQAAIVALPNLTNFFQGLFKSCSVVFCIGVVDIMSAAKIEAEVGYRYIEAYLTVGVIYLLFSIFITKLSLSLEKKTYNNTIK